MMSYWTFSDVFEEQGVVKRPFYGGFGLMAEGGLPKPSFNAFRVLHRLGDQRLDETSSSAIVTRRADGTLVVAVWNLSLPEESGVEKRYSIDVKGLKGNRHAQIYRVDSGHGSLLKANADMHDPAHPTQQQIEALRRAAQLPPSEGLMIRQGHLSLDIPPKGLVILEIGK
jgi:xylan 1,4-beta-xylosidase